MSRDAGCLHRLRACATNLVSGRLIGHRDGYGFVVPDAPLEGTDLDIFIPPDGMGSALHGDRVEVHVQRSAKGFKGEGRMEGRVIQVTERAQKTVVGNSIEARTTITWCPSTNEFLSRLSFRTARNSLT